ncbi:MAG: hypothetical protein IT181_26020 [Acidobacteria bacterium]|nr:hypothetical protein [Acidobacteriota bacterium]
MITAELVQHAVVTVVAMAAVAIVLRRLVGVARPAPGAPPACANCPSNASARPRATSTSTPQARTEHPLVFVRPPQP